MNLNQITVQVSNVESSVRFYEGLGLKLIVRSLPNYARFELPEGEATFSIHLSDSISTNGGTWIYFEVHNLDEKVQALIEQGYQFEEMPNDKPWLWREARIKDPDAHQLILYHAGSNRKDPPWKIV